MIYRPANGGGASLAHGDGHFEDAKPDSGEKDGDTDHVGHYPTEDTGFDGSQTEGYLVGETMSGENFVGHDSVKLVGCGGSNPK